jgi:hypothetical protein
VSPRPASPFGVEKRLQGISGFAANDRSRAAIRCADAATARSSRELANG